MIPRIVNVEGIVVMRFDSDDLLYVLNRSRLIFTISLLKSKFKSVLALDSDSKSKIYKFTKRIKY